MEEALRAGVHPPVNRSVKFSMMFTINTQVLNPQHIHTVHFLFNETIRHKWRRKH